MRLLIKRTVEVSVGLVSDYNLTTAPVFFILKKTLQEHSKSIHYTKNKRRSRYGYVYSEAQQYRQLVSK